MLDCNILVVDDRAANLEVVSQVLEESGYEVATALNGERALRLVQIHPPDLILLDIQMPVMDGFATCQALKANADTAGIPVIFMTALNDIENKVQGFEHGAVDYITKPFQTQELLARVRTHTQLHQLTQTLEARVADRTRQLQIALDQLHQSQVQIVQSEKMSTLGSLIAGIAHEVNNPTGFINASLNTAQRYTGELLEHLQLYQQQYSTDHPHIQAHAARIELDFLADDFPKMLNSMQTATDRIKAISHSLRTFSQSDTDRMVRADIHTGLDSTLLMLKYRLQTGSYRAEIQTIKNYGDIPSIDCFPGQLNQVFMNIFTNAIDMYDEISEASKDKPHIKPIITITTRHRIAENQVEIRIDDNGSGMDSKTQAQIFDYLFTTKPIGKGTGLGLAIAKQIVEEVHGGHLTVQSHLGKGSEFCICLPIRD